MRSGGAGEDGSGLRKRKKASVRGVQVGEKGGCCVESGEEPKLVYYKSRVKDACSDMTADRDVE